MRTTYLLAHTGIAVLLCLALAQSATAQTVFSGNSWSQFPGGAKAVCADADIDNDNDGLIEMCYLEDVNAIRHQLDGSGYKSSGSATKVTIGCKGGGCEGYELVRDLDFNDDDSYSTTANKATWTTDNGWPTIGDEDPGAKFESILEGNGHTIYNLFIGGIEDTNDQIGFIGYIGFRGIIQNLGLSNVNIDVTFSDSTEKHLAALAGSSDGVIKNCYVEGTLTAGGNRTKKKAASLVAANQSGYIDNSYVDIIISGLLGGAFVRGNSGNIRNSYIIGDVSSSGMSFARGNGSEISNVYYAANSRNNRQFVFYTQDSDNEFEETVSNSYWDRDKWQGIQTGAPTKTVHTTTNLLGFSTMALQTPTTPGTVTTDPYYKWSTDNWDFGNDREYPAVKYAEDSYGIYTACRNERSSLSQQPLCGTLLPGQKNVQPRITMPANNTRIAVTPGTEHTIDVTVVDEDIKDQLTLSLRALDPNQDLVEFATTTTTVMPNAGNPQRAQQQFTITIPTAITTLMTTLQLVAEDDSGLYNARSEPVSLIVAVRRNANIAPTIVIPTIPSDIKLLQDTSTTLNVIVADTNNDPLNVSVRSSNDKVTTATITPSGASRILTVTAVGESTATITVMVDDGRGEANSIASVSFTIEVEASAAPMPSVSPKSQIMQLNSTANITVSVSDDNYDLDDKVTLTASSLPPAIVRVEDPTRMENIDNKGNRLFTLTGVALGNATVTITATDSQSYSNSTTMTVHVNAPPMITSYDPELRIQRGSTTMTTVSVSDADISDMLTLELLATDLNQDIVALPAPIKIMPNNLEARSARTLTIRGLKGGRIPLTLIVSDGSVTAEVRVTVIVEVPPQAPVIESVSISDRLQHRTNFFYSDAIRVQVSDANYASGDVVTVTARSSDRDILLISGQGRTNINNHTAELGAVRHDRAVGDVIITITAKDSTNRTDTVRKLVRFQGPPRIVGDHSQVRVTKDLARDINVTVSDPNFDEVLTLELSAVDTNQDIVEIITMSTKVSTNNKVTRESKTMRVKGLKEGNTMLTLMVTDESGRSAQQQMTVTVEPNTKPTIALDPPTASIGLASGASTMLDVVVGNDGNVSEDPADFTVSVSSSDPAVAVARLDARSGKTTYGLTVEAKDIATVNSAVITVTVDDGRSETNSTNNVSFTVRVEPNEAPVLSITPAATMQTLPLNSMTDILVSAADANYDVGDMVDITVESNNTDIVSVAPSSTITVSDDEDIIFTLDAKAVGNATLTISAEDSKGASVSKPLEVRVNALPMIVRYDPSVTVQAGRGREASINVEVSDEDVDDVLTVELRAPSEQRVVSLETTSVEVRFQAGNMTWPQQTLQVKGLAAGTTLLTLGVSDGSAEAQATIAVTATANATPTLTAKPAFSTIGLLEGTATTWTVTVDDEDSDDDPAGLMVSAVSDEPTVAMVSIVKRSDGTYLLEAEAGRKEGEAMITVSVDDGREVASSVLMRTFAVTVGENQAPAIAVTSAPQQALAPGSRASIVVSIEDINFGVGDEVDVTALSSTPTVASISPAEHTGITANTTRGFTVFAKEGGITDIRFTAEDSKGASVSETLQVRVNNSPKVTGAAPTGPVIATVGEEFRLATSDFFSDADGDVLTYQVTGLPNSITMITTDTLSGIPLIGDAMMNNGRFSITVSVDDGNGGSAEVMFTLLIDAKPSGTVSIAFTPWQLTATSNIMDDNDIASMSYQWYRDDTQIGSETSDRYSIPNTHLGRAAGTQYYVEATIVDHIGQSVTFTSNVYEVVNEAPTISAISQIGVNEGETVSISPTIADANRDSLTYSWSVTSGDTSPSILAGVATNEASLSFEVPPDWIADTVTDNAQRTLQIQLTVSDGSLSAMRAASVVVTKINNGVITIPGIDRDDDDDLRAFSIEVVLSSDEDGENNSPGLSYQWQQCLGSDTNVDCDMEGNWRDIMNATSDSYRAASAAVGDRYRVKISYTDAQGYSEEVLSHERPFDTSNDIRIRTKIFLEGSLQ